MQDRDHHRDTDSSAEARLHLLATIAAITNITSRPTLSTAHIFDHVMRVYYAWDPVGAANIGIEGRRRTLEILTVRRY